VAEWAEENVAVVDAGLLDFLRALAEAVRRRRAGGEARPQAVRVVGKLPYKALDFFEPTDQDIFCGREVEAPVVYRMILSYPLLTLFGQSGVGKTSLLKAGVLPRLAAEGYDAAYVRVLGDPLLAVRQEVCRALGAQGREREGKTLLDFLRAAVGEGRKLVVILDQFEELFTRSLSPTTQRAFWRELGACLDLQQPEVRFVLSLREDFLPHLDQARRPVDADSPPPAAGILAHSYRLQRLEVDTARLAIVEPAARANCTVEPLLADVLLGRAPMPAVETSKVSEDLRGLERAWSLVETDGAVPPPSLQIVMTRLYLDALAAAGHAPPPEKPDPARPWQPPSLALTLAGYRASGGAGAILAGYIEVALAKLGTKEHPGDRQLAEAMLRALVTTRATKTALDEAELLEELAQAQPDFDPAAELAALRATRGSLVDLRLLRSFQVGERSLVELAHDLMAAKIAAWIDEAAMQAKLARELLRQQVESWQRHKLLIAPEALRLIHAQREQLRRLNALEAELLLHSALATGYEASYWFGRACAAGVAADAIALEGLRSDNFRTRAAAVTALSQLGDRFADSLIPLLADFYPQARSAAIGGLERLRPDGVWRKHLKYECYVPAGEFIMGDDNGSADEKPAHRVYLDAFYIGKYPITNADYGRYRADVGRHFDPPAGKADHPVVDVAWYDAADYAAWAGMRLPTEAEWEKAASWEAGDKVTRWQGDKVKGWKRRYPWGDEFDKNRCNSEKSGISGTTPVGKYSPRGDSPYGCADMAGNVCEWCNDWYDEDAYRERAGRVARNPVGPDTEVSKVMRGGSYYEDLHNARCASRHGYFPVTWLDGIGFRVARSSP
jgi:iron(II)-dependent oxidoreductase